MQKMKFEFYGLGSIIVVSFAISNVLKVYMRFRDHCSTVNLK